MKESSFLTLIQSFELFSPYPDCDEVISMLQHDILELSKGKIDISEITTSFVQSYPFELHVMTDPNHLIINLYSYEPSQIL